VLFDPGVDRVAVSRRHPRVAAAGFGMWARRLRVDVRSAGVRLGWGRLADCGRDHMSAAWRRVPDGRNATGQVSINFLETLARVEPA
jgi:hypothetical protein